ncbi:MAG: hypothetical protein K0S65_6359 [Labilithrix sp.]|nr:hypothetical protein [Labilithrix sp.]
MELRRNPELERVILGDPLDPDAWLVYGDWLEEAGDPRGELVAVQARHARDPGNPELLAAQRALFARHGDLLLDGLHSFLTPHAGHGPLFRLSWEFGFIWTANVTASGHSVDEFVAGLRALLGHPSARFLHALALGAPPENAWPRVVPVLTDAGELPFRILFLGDSSISSSDPRPAFGPLGDLGSLWPSLPHLRCLELRGGAMTLGRMDLRALRELVIETSALQRSTLRSLATSRWPELEKLELWFGDRLCTCTLSDLEPVLEGGSFPALRHLGLRNCAFVDRLCQALGSARIARQLRVLDLSLGTLTEAGAHALLSAEPALSNLAVLDLHHHYIPRSTAQGLDTLARFVDISGGPHGLEEDGGAPQVWLDA